MKPEKVIKIIGNIIMIAAVVFVIKKLMGMDIKLSDLREGRVMLSLGICFVFQTVIIIFSCYPWLVFTRVLSGRSIPFSSAMRWRTAFSWLQIFFPRDIVCSIFDVQNYTKKMTLQN